MDMNGVLDIEGGFRINQKRERGWLQAGYPTPSLTLWVTCEVLKLILGKGIFSPVTAGCRRPLSAISCDGMSHSFL